LIAQVAGTDHEMTKRIAYTFGALVKLGDFSGADNGARALVDDDEQDAFDAEEQAVVKPKSTRTTGLRPEFHYNFQIHLPANGTEETYLNIFNSLRKVFQ
jgi:hypothetical protein